MKVKFVAKRFFQVFVAAFVILTAVYVLRGQQLTGAVKDAAAWALVSAAMFAGAMVYHQRKNRSCDLCRE